MKTYAIIEGLKQEYDKYTPEDYSVWKILFDRQISVLNNVASREYLNGIKSIGFRGEKIPDFSEVNTILGNSTGWSIVVVPGIISEPEFFKLLSQKKFPATTWLRKMSQLDYLEEPDMFHDVFGHMPLLTNTMFSDFFEAIGKIGVQHINHNKITAMLGRMYWFTVEFGLINENGKKKIYGAGIISSGGETKFSLSDEPQHLPFDAQVIMNTPFQNDKIQDKYFLIESFNQLCNSIETIKKIVGKESVL